MKITSVIISLIAIFTLLGIFDAQAQIPPNAPVQQALVNAMWQETDWHGKGRPTLTTSIIFGAIGLIILAISIPLGRTDYGLVGMAYAAALLLGAIASYEGYNLTVTRSQKEFETRAEKIAEVMRNPEVEILSAVQTKKGLSVTLWVKGKTSKQEQNILGKTVEVMTVERESEERTLTPLMLANLAPLNIKIAGQPISELVAKK